MGGRQSGKLKVGSLIRFNIVLLIGLDLNFILSFFHD